MQQADSHSIGTEPGVIPAVATEAEIALVRRATQGDPEAFATLFQVHRARVYAICLRMTNNSADADDVTQEAFIHAFRKLNTFRGDAALSTWLHRIAVNAALMHFRRKEVRHQSLESCVTPGPNAREFGRSDDRLKHSLDRIALTRALEVLPLGYRTIFEMHEVDGYGHREIAKLLNCTVGNSKSQLHKAKQRIRECLGSRRLLAGRLLAKTNYPLALRARMERWGDSSETAQICKREQDPKQNRTTQNSNKLVRTQSASTSLALRPSSIQTFAETSA